MPVAPYGIELSRLAQRWSEQPKSTCFAALAEALRKQGALDDAVRVATTGIAARPEYLPGHLVLARILADRQEWDLAFAEVRAALMIDPDHPVAVDAQAEIGGHLITASPSDTLPDQAHGDAPEGAAEDDSYLESDHDAGPAEPAHEPVVTESLAMVYHGQGHLEQAVNVLDALVARSPGNNQLVAKRDAMRAELDVVRPRPYHAAVSGGEPVHRWLASLATARAPAMPPVSSLDAFYQAPSAPPSDVGDLAAFQAWLRELER